MECMTVVELVEKLEARDYRVDAIARIIGYCLMIQRLGWDALKLRRSARFNLEKLFRALEVDPLLVDL